MLLKSFHRSPASFSFVGNHAFVGSTSLVVGLNWTEELKRLVPADD